MTRRARAQSSCRVTPEPLCLLPFLLSTSLPCSLVQSIHLLQEALLDTGSEALFAILFSAFHAGGVVGVQGLSLPLLLRAPEPGAGPGARQGLMATCCRCPWPPGTAWVLGQHSGPELPPGESPRTLVPREEEINSRALRRPGYQPSVPPQSPLTAHHGHCCPHWSSSSHTGWQTKSLALSAT